MILDNHPELKTDRVFLLGNGKSRSHFDLERLRGKGTIIGCNAIYRDFTPDILVAIDAKMLKEIGNAKYTERSDKHVMIIPHNRHYKLKNAFIFKTNAFNTSGCFSMMFIDQVLQPSECFMLGMDGYKGNVYDATPNYAKATLQNFSGILNYYIKQLQIKDFKTTYINVNEHDAWGERAHETGRYKHITYEKFENLFKDFGSVPQLAEGAGLDSV